MMKQLFILMCMLVCFSGVQAQTMASSRHAVEERVTIDGSKGKLQAILQKPVLKPGEQCPMVIFCHGFGGSKDGPLFELITDTLQAHGIASIRFDFNGHGESEGDFQEMTVPNEIEDAKHVYAYVRDLRYINSIAIVGHSQGGVVASMTAGQLGTDALRAVVLMAPAAVLRDDAIRGSTMGKMYDPLDPPEYVELWGGDRVVPFTYGERYHQLWPRSEYVLLERYDHGFMQDIHHATDIVSKYLMKVLQ